MVTFRSIPASVLFLLLGFLPLRGFAEDAPHGPTQARGAFPSHRFSLSPHLPERPQLAFHFGLIQPILFRGSNAAVDLRMGRLVLTYSHGQGLDYSASPTLGLTREERDADLSLHSPWTTGGGAGITLLDELYLLIDVKAHRYHARVADQQAAYTTVSVGAELGWRFFFWKGLFLQAMLRFWPNVWTSLPNDAVTLGPLRHQARDLGFFANASLGWAFEI